MMPNFLIIGAAKSGTTSLYYYLKQHPQIFMSPVKEPSFFAIEGEPMNIRGPGGPAKRSFWIADLASYRALFEGVRDERAVGEASVLYMYHPQAAERIRRYNPEMKLIAVLRNPVERAYSSFCFLAENAAEPLADFEAALAAEEARIRERWEHLWHYKSMGYYYQQLKRYYERFDRSQVRVYLYEEFNRDNLRVLQDIFRFLEVDSGFVPNTSVRYLESGLPKNRRLQRLVLRSPLRKLLRTYLPERLQPFFLKVKKQTVSKGRMDEQIRRSLTAEYREEILRLQELIDQDLSGWLEPLETPAPAGYRPPFRGAEESPG